MSDRGHRAIEQEPPPGDRSPGHSAVKDRQPGDDTDPGTWRVQAGRNQQRVNYGLVTVTFPRDRPQRCDLGPDGKVEESPNLLRRHGVHYPPKYNHAHADCDHAAKVELRRPRQRAKWDQDAGILDRKFVPGAY